MRFSSVIVAIGAITSVVHATKVIKRGTYEMTSVLGSNNGYYPPSPAPSSPPSSSCMTHNVMVGGSAGLVYTPDQITANVGDTVIFTFGVKNHTASQSSFAQPCSKLDGGVDSGFMPTDGSTSPTFEYTVTSTSPQWFYCMQANHCEQGMVFAINAPATGAKTFGNFKNNAMGMGMGSGTSTIYATSTASTTTSVYGSPAPPTYTTIPGTNVGTDEQCQCVCNIDISNGAPNNLQGIGVFGGSVGSVQLPWGIDSAPEAGPAAAVSSSPAGYNSPPSPSNNDPPTATGSVAGIQNVGQGTIVPFGDNSPAAAVTTGSAPPAATGSTSGSTGDSSEPAGGFESNGQLGGAAGR